LLADWRDSHHTGEASGTTTSTTTDTNGGALVALDLVRVVPSTAPEGTARVDAATPAVDVTYCNYHDADDATTLVDQVRPACTTTPSPDDENPRQCLLFVTPATLYRALGVLAEGLPAINGTNAPAAMRHEAGLADVLCVDEASMLDLPRLLLAGSVLQPTGQTLLVGDHRQLSTVTEVDWSETLRKPIRETQAHRSALGYVRWLNATVDATGVPGSPTPPSPAPNTEGKPDTSTAQISEAATSTDDATPDSAGQTRLSGFDGDGTDGAERQRDGEADR
jgi:hypothetical protein